MGGFYYISHISKEMEPFLLLILTLFLIIITAIFLHNRGRAAVLNLPPSPKTLPIFGNLHQLGEFPNRSLLSLSKLHGPLMLLHYGRVPVVIVSSAAAAEEIFKNQDLIFSNRPKLSIPDPLTYGSRDVAFSPYGEHWRRVRSVCVLHLLSSKRVQSFRRVREEETTVMVEKIRQSEGCVVNLSDLMVEMTNGIICRVSLGKKYGEEDEDGKRFRIVLKEWTRLLGDWSIGEFIPWLAWVSRASGFDRKVKRIVRLIDGFMEEFVEEHRNGRERGKVRRDSEEDFLDILLELQSENEVFSGTEDDTIKAIILDMFAAGTETTSTTLQWAMSEVLRNPRVMTKLQNEIEQVAQGKKDITEDDLDKMPYLDIVLKESIRLHTPAPLLIPREASQDTKLMGYDIKAHTQVIINAWAIARDPTSWENPTEFYPERFLNSNVDYKGFHFELIPFGAGRRGCPGMGFGVSINKLALAKLVYNFEFALYNGKRVEDLDMSESYGITIQRKLPLLVIAASRGG